MSATHVIVGGCVSLTVTENEQVAEVFPLASVPTHETTVVPFGKADPDAGLQAYVAPGQLSLTEATNATTAEHWPGSVGTEMFAGQTIVGGVVSTTVNVVVQVAEFPDWSLTVIVIVVWPLPTSVPAAGLWVVVKSPDAVQLSVADTLVVTAGTGATQFAL